MSLWKKLFSSNKEEEKKEDAPAEDEKKEDAPAEDEKKEEAPAEDEKEEDAPAEDEKKEDAPAEDEKKLISFLKLKGVAETSNKPRVEIQQICFSQGEMGHSQLCYILRGVIGQD